MDCHGLTVLGLGLQLSIDFFFFLFQKQKLQVRRHVFHIVCLSLDLYIHNDGYFNVSGAMTSDLQVCYT